jgi:hypothetical protein
MEATPTAPQASPASVPQPHQLVDESHLGELLRLALAIVQASSARQSPPKEVS